MPDVRVLTWNLQGSHGLDVATVAAVIRASDADAVVLQEVGRRQCRALASKLELDDPWWVFKHWAITGGSEGGAVLSRHRWVATSSVVLRRAPFWSWRRRIAAEATMSRNGEWFAVVGVHLSPHADSAGRHREAGIVVERASTQSTPPIICGDLNEAPGGPAYAAFTSAGWIDAWRAVHGDDAEQAGATNWTAGERRGRPPTQRLDYVLAPPGWRVESCSIAIDGTRLDEAATLSDHLPVTARLLPPLPGTP